MAVSAKNRYEVLRRDRYACRFCGFSAADGALLEIDHVILRREGGSERIERGYRRRGREPEPPPEDDYTEMYAYMDAYGFLESQPAGEVLRAIMRVCADVYPYRPTGTELIPAAAKVILEQPAPTGVPF